jgi:hypothetical protein
MHLASDLALDLIAHVRMTLSGQKIKPDFAPGLEFSRGEIACGLAALERLAPFLAVVYHGAAERGYDL